MQQGQKINNFIWIFYEIHLKFKVQTIKNTVFDVNLSAYSLLTVK